MWYAVETAFVDGNHFKSQVVYDLADEGCPHAGVFAGNHQREPHNSRQTFMNGLIEIHTDWFQTLEQARQFANGAGTYICHYTDRWLESCRSWQTSFQKWEFVPLNGREPWRGIYEHEKIR